MTKTRVVRRRRRDVALERRLARVLQQLLAKGYDWGELSRLSLAAMGVPRIVYAAQTRTPKKRGEDA